MATYKIHPGIGIARLGNSETDFYLAPETPAGLPQECGADGNPLFEPDGVTPRLVQRFKDAEGRIKRQAARFQIFVYDEESPEGRPLRLGDHVEGGGNRGKLVDIQWRVYVANKKACWYQFDGLSGEHGHPDGAARRNAAVPDSRRERLIIDPGPRSVNVTTRRRAPFDRSGEGGYATNFPPAELAPNPIDTLGEMMTDDAGRLLVLGGYGRSGSELTGPGEPHIEDYANNDGWYDDTADGPVMARLVMFSDQVQRNRFVDVEYPAWVVVGYPRFVPEMLDMVTMDEVVYDTAVRELAGDTALYGRLDSFDNPDRVDPSDETALRLWKAGRLTWNRSVRPWFYRDIWPILYRPDEFRFLTDILGQSNFPHDQQQRGTFDPWKLAVTPRRHGTRAERDAARDARQAARDASQGEAVVETAARRPKDKRPDQDEEGRWIEDPYWPMRNFLFDLLRLPGEENEFRVVDRVSSRLHNLPLMPLLCGDNPLDNLLPSKFLRLTDYQLFILKQWAEGKFINEIEQGWLDKKTYNPYQPYPTTPPRTGRELDRGVLSNALGGAFCPGGEVGWILRNPSVYREPYRIKADRSLSDFIQSAATAIQFHAADLASYTFNVENPLSQDNDYATGLQPGDLTKSMALPWQGDFNECTTNPINVTYADWNVISPEQDGDRRLIAEEMIWETLWWPAHRPVQVWDQNGVQVDWSNGIPQTNAGDLRMVTEWSKLGFVLRNPALPPSAFAQPSSDLNAPKYVVLESG